MTSKWAAGGGKVKAKKPRSGGEPFCMYPASHFTDEESFFSTFVQC